MLRPPFQVVEISPYDLERQVARELLELAIPLEQFPRHRQDLSVVHIIADADSIPSRQVNEFLADLSQRSRSIDGNSTRTYAEALASWLNHCHSRGIHIETTREPDLQEYRNYLAAPRPNGKGLASATVRLIVGTVLRFLRWGSQYGNLRTPLGDRLLSNPFPGRFRNRFNLGQNYNPVINLPKQNRVLPKALTAGELKKISSSLSSPYRLMFRWALCTGMRRTEICRLKISDLSECMRASAQAGIAEIRILRKGGKMQSVFVIRNLLEETFWYLTTERPDPKFPTDILFLNKNGTPVVNDSLSKAYRRACIENGVLSHFHMLRHTFAVSVLAILERQVAAGAEINPLKILQTMLGHASLETTDIYLRTIEVTSPTVEMALGFLYGYVEY